MDFGELRMDSADLLDLLGDNNMPFDQDGLDLSLSLSLDHLADPTPVKEEPVELPTDLKLESSSLEEDMSPADHDYRLDAPGDGTLSTSDEAPEPSGVAAALPVVTTGEASMRKATTRASAQQQKKTKRSRRVRTPKQQELNRLAQQRYRERKKQKYSSLQQAVDALSEQLEKVAVVEEERDNLQAENEDLKQQLKAQAAKLHARDNMIRQQQKQMDSQQAEITSLKHRLGALTPAESSTDVRLLQQLASAVKTAFEENDCSSAQMVLNQFPEMLMEHISKTVRQCCRELDAQAAAPKPLPQVVQVSCC